MKTLIPTFIENLLDNTLKEKPFTILASRPSVGKTSLALQMCSIAMKKEKGVLVFSVEMDRHSVFERIICSSAETNASQVRKGRFSKEKIPFLSSSISNLGKSSV